MWKTRCLAVLVLLLFAGGASAHRWTYPGDLNSHLTQTHGVSTAGLSREQMLNLHDSIHEGRVYEASAGQASRSSVTFRTYQRRFAPFRVFRR
jgi:hypothetical protein